MFSLNSVAASVLAGDSGFGSESSDLTEVKIAQTSYTELHWFCNTKIKDKLLSRHILPSFQMLGWNISDVKTTWGTLFGYYYVNEMLSSKNPPSHGVPSLPAITAYHFKRLLSIRVAFIPSSSSLWIFCKSFKSRLCAGLDIFHYKYYKV